MNKNYNKKNSTIKTVPSKKKTIDKNQLLAYLLALLIIFWTVAGVFGLIAFGRTSKKSNNLVSASAQTVDSIKPDYQLEIELPYLSGLTLYDNNGTISFAPPKLLIGNSDLLLQTGNLYMFGASNTTLSFYTDYTFISDNNEILYYSSPMSLTITPASSYNYYFPSLLEFDAIFLDYVFEYNSLISCLDVTITLKMDYEGALNEFTFTISYPYFGTPNDVDDGYFIPFTSGHLPYNEVTTFENTLGYGVPTAEFLLYYNLVGSLSPDALLSYEMAYNQGFQQGRFYGLKESGGDAFNEGYLDGYDVGKQEGFVEGKTVGNEEGIEESDVYSFASFLSAIFDAPVATFVSFLNFELLGINLLNFFLAFISVGVIIAVIRLFL